MVRKPTPRKREAATAGAVPRNERYAAGKALRDRVPRERHGDWKAPPDRRDPVGLVIASSRGRIPELIPIRYGRMSVSPFTFYRGTALNMAADLAGTPIAGMRVQLCGDCHLLNFGGFATPERRVIFDINDFDETLPGPWEWDVKRLAASMVQAARSNGFSAADQRDAARACARSYRERIAEYSGMKALEVWYSRVDAVTVLTSISGSATRARMRRRLAKAGGGIVADGDFPKIVTDRDGRTVIRDYLPHIGHDQLSSLTSTRTHALKAFAAYRKTLPVDRRVLLDRYRLADFAMKVVGVGSVGTFCGIALLMAENDDPLFLQVKEAHASVLEPYVAKSVLANHGERIVVGQRLMQSASDIFLGWTAGDARRHFYLRQLHDVKLKPMVEIFDPATMIEYGELCAWTLARAHARSGDAAMIAGYLGRSDVFDRAIARFARSYADQTERDYASFMDAIRRGRIDAQIED